MTPEQRAAKRRLAAWYDAEFARDGGAALRAGPNWRGCALVNPLCPNDLCGIDGAHLGHDINVHILGTCAGPEVLDRVMYQSTQPHPTQASLIHEGVAFATMLWPDDPMYVQQARSVEDYRKGLDPIAVLHAAAAHARMFPKPPPTSVPMAEVDE